MSDDRSGPTGPAGLADHFFRHEYGRLVALLTRRVGVRHLSVVEDGVQSALLASLTAWTTHGTPDDPGAWLYRVAFNQVMGDLRQAAGRTALLARAGVASPESGGTPPPPRFAHEVADDLLRMLFV